MEHEDVLKRIKKCLALSESSNEHEAAAALRQAQKLMAAYNITKEALTDAELGLSEGTSTAWVKTPQWDVNLAALVGRAFGCHVMHRRGAHKVLARMMFLGVKRNAELAAYTYVVLQRQLVKARDKHVSKMYGSRGEKIKAGESFCRGYVATVGAAITKMAQDPAVEKAIQDRADRLSAGAKFEAHNAKLSVEASSYYSGAAQGKEASLFRPMNQKEAQKQITA